MPKRNSRDGPSSGLNQPRFTPGLYFWSVRPPLHLSLARMTPKWE